MTILSMLATVFGFVGGIANLPQAIKIFRSKSAKDISITTYTFIMAGAIIWLLYGLELGNFPIILGNSSAILCVGAVIIGWFSYGRSKG